MLGKFLNKTNENSLTATVFSQLLHLPCEEFWQILSRACYTKSLPDNLGELKSLKPWPYWNTEKNRVFPDFFLRFDKLDVIIEAKRGDNGGQYKQQWINELDAYINEYGKDKCEVRIIALGGLFSESDVPLKLSDEVSCTVHMCRWSRVLLECQRLKQQLEGNKNPDSQTLARVRILEDLIAIFNTFGYAAIRWFEDFDFETNLLDYQIEPHQHYLQDISRQFHL